MRRSDDRSLGEMVKDSPLTSAAIAAAVGFFIGGGARTRIGIAALAFAGRMVARELTVNYLMGSIREPR